MLLPNFKSRQTYTKIAFVLFALAVGAASVAPFFFSRYEIHPETREVSRLIYTHDLGTHVTIMKQFDDGLRAGVLYPRWLADTNHGYGIATMVYYPPNVFYMCSIIHLFVKDWIDTMFVLAALSVALSGMALFWFLRLFYGRAASCGAALVYMLLPYHQIDLYWRGAFPEFMGFVFVPLILRAVFQLGSQGRFKDYAAVSLLYGLYVMTHLPVSYIFTYALAFYVLSWALLAKDWKILFRVGAGMALGLGVCAIYWLPAALESKAAYEWVTDFFQYHQSYITPFASDGDTFTQLIRKIFHYQAWALTVAILSLLFARRSKKSATSASDDNSETTSPNGNHSLSEERDSRSMSVIQERLWMMMAILTTLMTTKISYPVSVLIPKIQVAVPAWRWLLIASAFTSLLIGAGLDRLLKRETSRAYLLWIFRTAMICVIAMNFWLTYQEVIKGAMSNPTYHAPAEFEDSGWIPANASGPRSLPNTPRAIIAEGGSCEVLAWQPQYREILIDAKMPAFLRLKTYNFPGWVARLDGQAVEIKSDSNGAQVFPVPAGKHTVVVEFINTPPRNLGTAISAISLLFAVSLLVLDFRKRKNKNEEPQPE